MSETTLDKIQGARDLADMFRWAGMSQREIQALESAMGNALDDTRNRVTGVSHDLAATRNAATDAGIALWRHGPAGLRDAKPAINPWQPSVDLDGPMIDNPMREAGG